MKYTITDEEHVNKGKVIEADDPADAAVKYVEQECLELGVGDEVTFTMSDDAHQWEVTVEIRREFDVFFEPIRKTRAKPKAAPKRKKTRR